MNVNWSDGRLCKSSFPRKASFFFFFFCSLSSWNPAYPVPCILISPYQLYLIQNCQNTNVAVNPSGLIRAAVLHYCWSTPTYVFWMYFYRYLLSVGFQLFNIAQILHFVFKIDPFLSTWDLILNTLIIQA